MSESTLTTQDREAARAAGYEAGMQHRFGLLVDDRARALLHQDACNILGFARRLASVKGPAWTALVMEAAESDD